MNLQSLRSASRPNRGYVCLHCRLQCAPASFERALRKRLVHSKLVEPTKEASLATTLKDETLSTFMEALATENSEEKPKVELSAVRLRKHFSLRPVQTDKPPRIFRSNASQVSIPKSRIPTIFYLANGKVNDCQKIDKGADVKKISTDSGQSNDTVVQNLSRKQPSSIELSHKSHPKKQSTPENDLDSLSLPDVTQKLAKGRISSSSSSVKQKRKNAKGEIKSGIVTKQGSTAVKAVKPRGSKAPAKPPATLQSSQNRVNSLKRGTKKTRSALVSKKIVRDSFETAKAFKNATQMFEGGHSSKSHSNDPSGLQDNLAAAEKFSAVARIIETPSNGSESRKSKKLQSRGDNDDDISSMKKALKNQVITINSKQLQLNCKYSLHDTCSLLTIASN